MADNVIAGAPVGTGTIFATDDIGLGVQLPRAKVTWGPDGSFNDADVAANKALPVQLRNTGGTEIATAAAPLRIDPTGTTTQPIGDAAGSLTVDSPQLPATLGQKAMAASLPVTLASDQASVPVAATLAAETTKVIGTVNIAAAQSVVADTELPAAAALADGASATPTTPTVGAVPLLMNATTEDRQRAVVNAMDSIGTGVAAAGLVGQLDDVSTGAVTENQFAPVRISSRRALLVEGVASGTAVKVDGSGVTQPVSGTVTTSPPANASTNLAQIAGIAPDVNSGNKSAGTLRVTLATDQVQLTNALKVDASSVAVPITDNSGSLTVDSPQLPASLGQKTMANSMGVAIASDQGNLPVAGAAAQGASVSGNPVLGGLRAGTADFTAVADAQAVAALATILGKQVIQPYALPANTWSYAPPAAGLTTTTGVTAKAAGAAGVRNYVTKAQITNSHQTIGSVIEIRDGASGTVLWRGWAQFAGGGVECEFKPPLRGSTATLIEIAEVTATSTAGVLVSLQGYSAAE